MIKVEDGSERTWNTRRVGPHMVLFGASIIWGASSPSERHNTRFLLVLLDFIPFAVLLTPLVCSGKRPGYYLAIRFEPVSVLPQVSL